jgi:hypothetical protein
VTDCKGGTQQVDCFGVRLAALDIGRVGENGNAEYRSEKAFGVGSPDDRFSRGLGPKYKDPISVNRWEKIAMMIAAKFLSSFTKLL